MPFTFSHPAAVLPLTYFPKRWISITGLVVGSMSPDFEYFLRMKIYSVYSHTWIGLFWFDLPLTIILAFIFHLLVRNELINNLPTFLTNRFTIFKNFNWIRYFKKHFIIILVSSIVGIATHILWDNFTHEQGQFVQSFNTLKNIVIIAGFKLPVYKLLQHSSTLIGGVIIIYALLKLPLYNVAERQKSYLPFWLLVALITLTVFVIRLLTGLDFRQYGNVIITLISGVLIGLFFTTAFAQKNIITKTFE